MALWLACALALMTVPKELDDFVARPDVTFQWSEVGKNDDLTELRMTSQTWQGLAWKHDIVVCTPKVLAKEDTVLLYITGDRVDRADLPFLRLLAEKSRLRVATLFQIPNQPLFELEEDDLIAHTFGMFLETGDATWPLLFPMTKAAVRAMDVIQKWAPRSKRFVVTGASKRGWTTWLTAATGDKRVVGIAPMVFDFLNFNAQLKHQMDSWGKYSEQLDDYVSRGQAEAAETPEGKRLGAMVDPFSYLERIRIPKLIVLGANDRYWTSDAHRLYMPALKGNTFFRIIPNVGHNLGGGEEAAASIGYFARGVAGTLQAVNQVEFRKGRLSQKAARRWNAAGPTRDFRDCTWGQKPPAGKWRAHFDEFRLKSDDLRASFTSPMTIEP